jgi:hypothetical protein
MALIAGFRSRAGNGNGTRPAIDDAALAGAALEDIGDDGDPGDLSQASVTGFGSEASDSSDAGRPGSTGSGRGAETTGDGLTYASELALPVPGDDPAGPSGAPPGHPAGRRWAPRRRRKDSPPPAGDGPGAPPGSGRDHHEAVLSLPVRAAAACALLVAGATLGAVLTGLAMMGGPKSASSPHVSSPAARSPSQRLVPPPGPAPSVLPPIPAGGPPTVVSLQPFGDPDTTFVIHGANWRPGSILTIALSGAGDSPIHPVVDGAGSFNYAINQDDEFRRGRLPPGAYQVTVTGDAGQRATVKFDVHNAPAPGPPPGQTPPPP